MKLLRYTLLFAALTVAFSCGDKEKKEENEPMKIGTKKESKNAAAGDENSIDLTGNDMMQFNKKEIRVKAGEEVTLTLRHIGKLDKKVMGHNFVLLKPGTDIQEFSLAASNAGESEDWIPNDGQAVIVHTKMLGGGQSDTITFAAPEPGTYDFICSFPGHSAMMRGKFIVE